MISTDALLHKIQNYSKDQKKAVLLLCGENIEIVFDKSIRLKNDGVSYEEHDTNVVSVWKGDIMITSNKSNPDFNILWTITSTLIPDKMVEYIRTDEYICSTSGLIRKSKVFKFIPQISDIISMVDL